MGSNDKSAVVLLQTGNPAAAHERQVQIHLAQCIARLLGCPFAGLCTGEAVADGGQYLVPDETLSGPYPLINGDGDLFGGLVPQPFMATKVISHPLVSPQASVPTGWTERFMEIAGAVVLPGYSAFSLEDARAAGLQLLQRGPLRLKAVQAKAGRGQQVIGDRHGLDLALSQQDEREIAEWGLVLEEDLQEVQTFSVGQVRIAGLTASYYGVQNLTQDNTGLAVYGGSDLMVVRGDYGSLLTAMNSAAARRAVRQTMQYENAAELAFAGFIASRRNCDVAVGIRADGRRISGVLEQSWRIGGASSAEIHALLALAADPGMQRVLASSWEAYGPAPTAPDGMTILFQGEDAEAGPLTKGVRVLPYASLQ